MWKCCRRVVRCWDHPTILKGYALTGSAPLSSPQVLDYFKLLGRSLAKALQDSRLMDLPLSHVFYRAALGRPLDMRDIAAFDPDLHASLVRLSKALRRHKEGGGGGGRGGGGGEVQVDGVPLSDLCLTFSLPGEGTGGHWGGARGFAASVASWLKG